MEEGQFRPWGSETSEPIHLKFGSFDNVHNQTPHAKYGSRLKLGLVWGGHMGNVVPLPAFFIFGSFSTPQLTPRRVDFREMHTQMCFGGQYVPLGQFVQGSNFPL